MDGLCGCLRDSVCCFSHVFRTGRHEVGQRVSTQEAACRSVSLAKRLLSSSSGLFVLMAIDSICCVSVSHTTSHFSLLSPGLFVLFLVPQLEFSSSFLSHDEQ